MNVASAIVAMADGWCALMRRIARALDDHWIGDLIGAASLFALLWFGLMAGWVLQ